MTRCLATILVLTTLLCGLPGTASAQTPSFSGRVRDVEAGYLGASGDGCATVVIEISDVTSGGSGTHPIEGLSLSLGHDPSLLTPTQVTIRPELISLLGFSPQISTEICTDRITITVQFSPDGQQATPSSVGEGLAVVSLDYTTVAVSFDGLDVPLTTEVTWAASPCDGTIPGGSAAIPAGGGPLIPLSGTEDGIVTFFPSTPAFIRGDATGDGGSSPINIADAILIIMEVFKTPGVIPCLQAADANDDEMLDSSDAIWILSSLFGDGADPPPPFPACGSDPTPGILTCTSYPSCCPTPPEFPGLSFAQINPQGYEEYALDLDPSVILIRIPGGTFDMGSNSGDPDEQPVHEVSLSPYFIAKYATTNAQYRLYCDMTQTPYPANPALLIAPPDYFTNPLYDDYPVTMVSYDELTAPGGYLAWAGLELVTEAQWEFAARGADGRIYPWGNEPPSSGGVFRANYCPQTFVPCDDDGYAYTCPVWEFGEYASPFGTVGQCGSTWEWCLEWYGPYPAGPVTDPTGPPSGPTRIRRGGGWYSDPFDLRATKRPNLNLPSSTQHNNVGFRTGRSIP